MKKTLFGLFLFSMILTSCEEFKCDTTTAKGAADCACYLHDQQALDVTKEDKSLSDDTKAGMQQWKDEVEQHLEAGDYTENELEAELDKLGCDI